MHDLPQNTMFSYLANPMFDKIDMSQLPISALAQGYLDFEKSQGKSRPAPETDALKFYFLNHAFHVMKSKFHELEELPDELAEVAQKHLFITTEVAKRLFFYSLIIAVEEARFMHEQSPSFWSHLKGRYGDEFHDFAKNGFTKKNHQFGSSRDLLSLGSLDMTAGEYCSAMVSVFAFGNWSPGFGGKGWVPIASLLSDCVHGALSFESMGDQAFSLCHNNGSMFNKGHLYQHYTHFIYEILDIQDSGQIPQWIGNNLSNRFVDKDLKEVFLLMKKHFPEEMSGPVNQALIKNSEAKRNKKAKNLANANYGSWNSPTAQSQKTKSQIEQEKAQAQQQAKNDVLLGGLGLKLPGM